MKVFTNLWPIFIPLGGALALNSLLEDAGALRAVPSGKIWAQILAKTFVVRH